MSKKNNNSDILGINANLKHLEYLLYVFDNEDEKLTLKEIRKSFTEKFKTNHSLLNQYFGIQRLLPLILMKQVNKENKIKLSGDALTMKKIRDCICHNDFTCTDEGYHFDNNILSYTDFNDLLYRIENDFYKI